MKKYFIEEQEVEWGKFLNALNSGDYTLAEATDEKEVLKSGNPEKEILDLKEKLLETDYKALKYAAPGMATEDQRTGKRAAVRGERKCRKRIKV